MTSTESNITKDMTAVEAAHLLTKLEEGHRAAWLSTREAPWHSAEYHVRFQNATEIDGIFRDVMRETVENGMRRPGEPVEEFAERAGSEAWLAGMRKAGLEPHDDRRHATGTHRREPVRGNHSPAGRCEDPGGPGIHQGFFRHRRELRQESARA